MQGLKVAGQKGREAASETLGAVTSPELKRLAQQDAEMTQQHAKQLDELLQEAGGQAGSTSSLYMLSTVRRWRWVPDGPPPQKQVRHAG